MRRRDQGFTLIEVLVAMAILAFAIAGLVATGTQSVFATRKVSEKTLAGFVADNEIARLRKSDADLRDRTGKSEQMGQDYNWRLEVTETELEGFYEIEIEVSTETQDAPIATRRAFLVRR